MAILDLRQGKTTARNTPTPSTESADTRGIRLLLRLQQTLEVEELIRHFADFLKEDMGIDGFQYRHAEAAIDCHEGHLNRHRLAYTLKLEGRELGQIAFYRARPFSPAQTRRVEDLLSLLIHPLHNALRFREALQHAHTDALTGLRNRFSLDEQLPREICLARRERRPLSLLIADIDHFKKTNDRHGHTNGDYVLVCVASRLKDSLRGADLLFRYGGEEFVIILSGSDETAAQATAERLRRAVEDLSCPLTDGEATGVTISVGVSSLSPADDHRSLFDRADAALYKAKQEGRNRIAILPAPADAPADPEQARMRAS